jgi:YrbI family 3-deoxy-D-manno-octulosonate 8-phosphate phosphatase
MIKLFLSDLDGCLTDGVYIVDAFGNVSKNFYTRDFRGFGLLRDNKINVGIVTYSTVPCDKYRISAASPFVVLHDGVKDKCKYVEDVYIKIKNYSWDEIAYIGDDDNDLELLCKVGMSACPSDAEKCVREHMVGLVGTDRFIMNKPGGRGCVREFIDIVLVSSDYHHK